MHSQAIERALQYVVLKSDLAAKIHGQQSEQYCQHLEDQASFYTELRYVAQAIPLWEKLLRIQKELNGGENNEKVYQIHQMLMTAYALALKFPEALLISQKNITIYRAINNNNELEDETVLGLIAQCGLL